MQTTPHWAEIMQLGDRAIATLRHPTDGSQNVVNARVIVLENDPDKQMIRAAYEGKEYEIAYNELV